MEKNVLICKYLARISCILTFRDGVAANWEKHNFFEHPVNTSFRKKIREKRKHVQFSFRVAGGCFDVFNIPTTKFSFPIIPKYSNAFVKSLNAG